MRSTTTQLDINTKHWIIPAKCCLAPPSCLDGDHGPWWAPSSVFIGTNYLTRVTLSNTNCEQHDQLNDTRSRIHRRELCGHSRFLKSFISVPDRAVYDWTTQVWRRRPPRSPWPWRWRLSSPWPRSPRCPAKPPGSCPAGPGRNRMTRATAWRSVMWD